MSVTRSRWATAVLSISCIGLAAALLLPLVGWRLVTVDTGSMHPAIAAGSLVLERAESVDELRVGQVVSYRPPTRSTDELSHRVTWVGFGEDGVSIRTRGDANPGEDPWQATIIGDHIWTVVGVVPQVGAAVSALRDRSASPILLLLGAVLALGLIWVRLPARTTRTAPGARGRTTGPSRWWIRTGAVAITAASVGTVSATSADAAWTTSTARGHQSTTAQLATPTLNSATATCLSTKPVITLRWTSPSDVRNGVQVQRRQNGSTTWTTVGATDAAATSYVDSTVTLATTYDYRIRHVRGAWTGLFSASVSASSLSVCLN